MGNIIQQYSSDAFLERFWLGECLIYRRWTMRMYEKCNRYVVLLASYCIYFSGAESTCNLKSQRAYVHIVRSLQFTSNVTKFCFLIHTVAKPMLPTYLARLSHLTVV